MLMAVLGTAPPAAAQAAESGDALRVRIHERITEMRAAISEGLPVITNVRVSVKLRNGHKISGVVKQGRFIERVDGLDFAPADVATPGAGLRIWYYNNSNSYVFLPFGAITSYKIGARLTDLQVKEIEAKIDADRKRADEARRDYLDSKAQRNGDEEGDGAAAEDGQALSEQQARRREEERLLALLEEFPPEQGWGAEKLTELRVRKITVGVYPDASAQRFIEVYKDWERALALRERNAAAAPAAPAPSPPAAEPTPEAPEGAVAPPPAGEGAPVTPDPSGGG